MATQVVPLERADSTASTVTREIAGRGARRRPWLASAALYAVLVSGALIVAFPFLWMVLTSFKSVQESNAYPPSFLPQIWRWQNYVDAWLTPPSTLGRYFF